MQDRRDLDPAPPARRTATAAATPPEPELGGPGPARPDTESAPPGLRLLVTPATILRWHRDIVRRRGAPDPCTARPAGDPPEHQGTGPPAGPREPRMGLPQDHRELASLGVKVAPLTAWEILNNVTLGPAPRRSGPTWPQLCDLRPRRSLPMPGSGPCSATSGRPA
jgi:hypothetical protein